MSPGSILRQLALLVVCAGMAVVVAAPTPRIAAFESWPEGTSPLDIGRRVARNFVPRRTC